MTVASTSKCGSVSNGVTRSQRIASRRVAYVVWVMMVVVAVELVAVVVALQSVG